MLRALIRSPTVSWPVDLYVVVLVPSLTVNVSVATKPSVSSVVLAVSGAVPVAIAGAAAVAVALDVLDGLEAEDEAEGDELLDDDELVLLEPLEPPSIDASADCTAAVSWLFTRLSAL